jgi:4-hydroxybutyrate CoA-transferase
VSVDVTRAAALSAGRIIAEVNPNMPCTGPESGIPLDRIDALVEVDLPVIEYEHPAVGEAARQIARYVAHLIGDGATLQVGPGRVPNEMLRFLEERRGLRIHSDLLTDPVVDLVAKGVVSGPVRGSFAMGTRRLYDFLDGNPEATLAPRHCATVGRSLCDRHAPVMQRSCRVSSFGSGTTTSVRVSSDASDR